MNKNKVVFIDLVEYSSRFARGDSAVLFYVKNSGDETIGGFNDECIKIRYGKDFEGLSYFFVLAGLTPLFRCRSDADGIACRAGAGRYSIESGLACAIKNHNPVCGFDVMAAYDSSIDLLGFLEAGFYLFALNDHYPAMPDGRFCAELSTAEYKKHKFYYRSSRERAFPAYLGAVCASCGYNEEKISAFRADMRNGLSVFATAIYLEDFLSVLIDGHHRAAAAYLQNSKITCRTIIPCSGYAHDGKKPVTLFFGPVTVDAAGININYLTETMVNRKNKILSPSDASLIAHGSSSAEWNIPAGFLNNHIPARGYADMKLTEGTAILGDINAKLPGELLNSPSPDYEAVEIMLDVLITTKDSKAYDFSYKIAGSEIFIGLWPAAFSYLARFEGNKEVEDLFINYLVNDEWALADVTAIVDDYFERIK